METPVSVSINTTPNPNKENGAPLNIYPASYTSVAIFEMKVKDIPIMRRQKDNYFTAAHILKIAGLDREKRAQVLEQEFTSDWEQRNDVEQDTWVPLERAKTLAQQYGVYHLIRPLLEFDPATGVDQMPFKESDQDMKMQPRSHSPMIVDSTNNNSSSNRQLPTEAPSLRRPLESSTFEAPVEKKPRTDGLLTSTKPNSRLLSQPQVLEQHRIQLKNIFAAPEDAHMPSFSFPSDLDLDTPIDDNMHTALHWAAALARIPIVKGLVRSGADPLRGNNVGETPLIRAVLVTNNADQDSFPELLSILGKSLRVKDNEGRTVLHHAALVAGVKGRAGSARYYLETILEHVALSDKDCLEDLVNARDRNGDTALNIAARVGNKSLVKALLDAGADIRITDKNGLRPESWGVQVEGLQVSKDEKDLPVVTNGEIIESTSTKNLALIRDLLDEIIVQFSKEKGASHSDIEATRVELRNITTTLASQRVQIEQLNDQIREAEDVSTRIRNMEKILTDDAWVNFNADNHNVPPSRSELDSVGAEFSVVAEGSEDELKHLILLDRWYEKSQKILQDKISRASEDRGDLERRLERFVAKYCQVESFKVPHIVDALIASLENDSTTNDLARVAGFLERLADRKNGVMPRVTQTPVPNPAPSVRQTSAQAPPNHVSNHAPPHAPTHTPNRASAHTPNHASNPGYNPAYGYPQRPLQHQGMVYSTPQSRMSAHAGPYS